MSFPLNSAQMYAHIEFFKKNTHQLVSAYNIATSASIDIFLTTKSHQYSAQKNKTLSIQHHYNI